MNISNNKDFIQQFFNKLIFYISDMYNHSLLNDVHVLNIFFCSFQKTSLTCGSNYNLITLTCYS